MARPTCRCGRFREDDRKGRRAPGFAMHAPARRGAGPALGCGALRFRYTIAFLAVLMVWAGLPTRAPAQSESTLRDRIERGRERERALSSAVARLDDLIARTGREITIVQGRLDQVQADLVA